jgi:hypothetical protein
MGGGEASRGVKKAKNRLNKNEQMINILPYQDI